MGNELKNLKRSQMPPFKVSFKIERTSLDDEVLKLHEKSYAYEPLNSLLHMLHCIVAVEYNSSSDISYSYTFLSVIHRNVEGSVRKYVRKNKKVKYVTKFTIGLIYSIRICSRPSYERRKLNEGRHDVACLAGFASREAWSYTEDVRCRESLEWKGKSE